MTARKHLKQLVRARMQKTGESYATARRQIIRDERVVETEPSLRWHFPGNVPATTALRSLLSKAGVRAPHTGAPFSEAMLFGIAGGIGVGVFAFHWEKEDVSTFFVAGRHKWWDDLDYLQSALESFGFKPLVAETTSAKQAAIQLEQALVEYGPCVAWVDMANLPHRAMPASWSGGGYHVATVYRVDTERGIALIGDLTDEPIAIPLSELAIARQRIKKQKNRLLSIADGGSAPDPRALIRQGLERCLRELDEPSLKPARSNVNLEALRVWGERLHGKNDAQSWSRVFRRGAPLWNGLISTNQFIEHYGTGGGLSRPLFADFLGEASSMAPGLDRLSEQYAALGQAWSALAAAALPDDVPAFREARELLAAKAELGSSGGSAEEVRAAWARLSELEQSARDHFPLSEAECESLRSDLKERVLAVHAGEVAALEQLRSICRAMG
jgi:hypothetical protein